MSSEHHSSPLVADKDSTQAAIASIKEVTNAAVIAIKETAAMAIDSIVQVTAPVAATDKGKASFNASVLDKETAKPVDIVKGVDPIVIVDADKDLQDVVKASDPVNRLAPAGQSIERSDTAAVEQSNIAKVTNSLDTDIVALKEAADAAVTKLQAIGVADVTGLKDTVTAAIVALKAAKKRAVSSVQKEIVPFPKLIWQIWQSKPEGVSAASVSETYKDYIKSWTSMNPDWTYTMVDNDEADRLIRDRFCDDVKTRDMFLTLTDAILRADLLRLLLLYSDGGMYIDLDAECYQPISEWKLDTLTHPDGVRLVVGIERDLLEGPMPSHWHDPIQFNNWTLAARPGSPLLRKVIDKIMGNIVAIAARKGTTIAKLGGLTTDEVLEHTTGPVAITRAMCAILVEETGKAEVWHSDFHRLSKPYAYNNQLLVFPKVSMANDFPEGASPPYTPEILLRHHFHHSWMVNKNVNSKEIQDLIKKGF